jgi:hypothetical protein
MSAESRQPLAHEDQDLGIFSDEFLAADSDADDGDDDNDGPHFREVKEAVLKKWSFMLQHWEQ